MFFGKKAGRFLYGIVIGCLLFGSMGCGMKTDGNEKAKEAQPKTPITFEAESVSEFSNERMVVKSYPFPKEKYTIYRNVHFYDGNLYCKTPQGNGLYGVSKIDAAGNASDVIVPAIYDGHAREKLLTFCVTQAGEICAVYVSQDQKAPGFSVARFDLNGNRKERIALDGEGFDEWNLAESVMEMDANGNYLIAKDSVRIFSADGKMLGEICLEKEESVSQMIVSPEGEAFVILWNGQENLFRKINLKSFTLEEASQATISINGLGKTDQTDSILAYGQDGLYRFDLKQKAMIPMLGWADCGIRAEMVIGVAKFGEMIFVFGRNAEAYVLGPGEELAAEPKKLVIATIQPKVIWQGVVADFNRSQSDWQIVIKEYGQESNGLVDAQESLNRMMIDLLGSEVPDLIDVSMFLQSPNLSPSVEEMMTKEYLEDLYPYLERSQAFSKSDFEEKIIDFCTYDGKLAAIPQTYLLKALMVDAETFGDHDGWTISEMIEYDKAHPERSLLTECNAAGICSVGFAKTIGTFADLEKKEARFDQPLIRELIRYAASYPKGNGMVYVNGKEQLVRICELENLIALQRCLASNFEKHGKFIGYPTMDGSLATTMSPTGKVLAICAKSEKKEGAWKFLEFVLSQEEGFLGESQVGSYGIPVNKKILQKQKEELSDPSGLLSDAHEAFYYDYENGKHSYILHCFTKEELALFDKMVDGATIMDVRHQKIMGMIYGECEPYFDGQKSLDAVIDAIQSRVNLYLKE